MSRSSNNPDGRPKRQIAIAAAALTEARIKAGFSQQEVAVKLGCKKSTISRWERGTYAPSAETIIKLMVLYKIDGGVIKGLGGADGK